MDKAYDLKALMLELKAEGLELAEDSAESVYHAVKRWLVASAALSTNPFDDMVAPFINQLDVVVLPQIDKINPADNQ